MRSSKRPKKLIRGNPDRPQAIKRRPEVLKRTDMTRLAKEHATRVNVTGPKSVGSFSRMDTDKITRDFLFFSLLSLVIPMLIMLAFVGVSLFVPMLMRWWLIVVAVLLCASFNAGVGARRARTRVPDNGLPPFFYYVISFCYGIFLAGIWKIVFVNGKLFPPGPGYRISELPGFLNSYLSGHSMDMGFIGLNKSLMDFMFNEVTISFYMLSGLAALYGFIRGGKTPVKPGPYGMNQITG